MTEFTIFNIPDFLSNSLKAMGIVSPTPIQKSTIPIALEGRDILASAQTGTGKTIAYLIPLLANLAANPEAKAVILAPTRELAMQIKDAAQKLSSGTRRIEYALLIGGDRMFGQLAQLRKGAKLIIGTPGRMNDHLERGSLTLKEASFLVLDETDRMLDMGFSEQLDAIKAFMPDVYQTLMFSATMPSNIESLSRKYLNNPERISVGPENTPSANIKQLVIHTSEHEKFTHLTKELLERTGSVIIFVKTKRGADDLADLLRRDSHKVDAIHGDLNQTRRQKAIFGFRSGKCRILVATDVAARGLDVPHVEHVINFDLPMQAEDYVHRIGRTGRAGAEGNALSFISPDDIRKWKMISRLINPDDSSNYKKDTTPYQRRSPYSGGRSSFSSNRGSSQGEKPYERSGQRSYDKPYERSGERTYDRSDDRPYDQRPGNRSSFGGRRKTFSS
jgi:ATP-dependent RNA helicase DeaD